MQHKWHKEIKAWADGAEIEQCHKDHTDNQWDDFDGEWGHDASGWKFRIKPQPKEPKYLYVYKSENNRKIHFSTGEENNVLLEYVGKIKLEVDDHA